MVGGIIIIVGIILMIMIHESGHFLAAKALDMKVTEFFFGFGPRLWSIQRGETEYGIKAFPVGGYVRIIGMNPYEEIAPEDVGRTYRGKPFWAKSVVVLASSTLHRRLTAPLSNSIAETSEVLPVSEWPTTATLRMFSVAYTVMEISSTRRVMPENIYVVSLWPPQVRDPRQ